MSDYATIANDLHPVARAAAELRALQAGQSLSDYLAALILSSSSVGSHDAILGALTAAGIPTERMEGRHGGYRLLLPHHSTDWHVRSNDELWGVPIGGPSHNVFSELTASPALDLVCSFNARIHNAAVLMSAAFHEAAVSDFEVPKFRQPQVRGSKAKQSWYIHIVHDCLTRSREVRNALVHHWTPTPRAERLAIDAFVILSDLTPARTELLRLCQYDRPRAFMELAKHIDLATDQFRLSADLLAEVEAASQQIEPSDEQRFADISNALLDRAGGGVSLTEGATLLKTSRQALHKRVKLGSALGMMQGTELTLPRFQFVAEGEKTAVVPGLAKIVKLFDSSGAGRWSALQFLVDTDPNLADAPRHALAEGRIDDVVHAARAYLGADADEA
jgi:hypothetical protein